MEIELQDDTGTLRRSLDRLSAVASRMDREINADLLELRQLIQADAPAERIEAQVERVADTLLEMNRQGTRPDNMDANPLQQLLELLTASPVSAGLRADGQALQARLREDGDRAGWRDALQLTQRTLEQLAAPGLVRRLFGVGRPYGAQKAANGDIPARARGALVRLINQLMLPESVSADVRQLRQRLAGPVPLSDLVELVERLVTLVAAASRAETEALQRFLHQLNERLLDLESFLADSTERAEAERIETSQLSRNVHEDLEALRRCVETAASVTELRESLPPYLDGIGHRLQSYLAAQEQRRHEDETRLRRLQRRLHEADADAENLRQSLMQQRLRAQTDTLTGLPNREAYRDRLEHEYARWRRSRAPLSLVLCDIDHFKAVNDRFGHQAGDQVLTQVGKILAERVRRSDLVARYGGEEFVLLMPNTAPRDAFTVADALREAVAAADITACGEPVAVTVCLGVAAFAPGDTPESAFERADDALYRAKRAGRNRVEIAE